MHDHSFLRRALEALDGVTNVGVSLERRQATIDAVDTVTDAMLKEAIEEEGYDVTAIE